MNKICHGGFSDWRIPNKDEIRSIADYDRTETAVDTDVFENCRPADYWTKNIYEI